MKFSRGWAAGLLSAGLIAGCTKQTPPAPAVATVAQSEKSAHFDAVNRHLELGGDLYGYVDTDGDADKIADLSQNAIAQLMKGMPGLEGASRIQLRPIMHALGLDDLKAFGFSSTREAGGEFRNHAFVYTPNGRRGLLRIFGGAPGPLQHLSLAPADADIYEEISFDVPALLDAIKQVIIAVKGQTAVDDLRKGAESTGAMAGVSPVELVHALKGRLTVILRVDPEKTIQLPGPKSIVMPRFALLIGIDGLAAPLKALLDKTPILRMKEEAGRQYYTPNIPMMIDGVHPVLAVSGADLYLGTDEFFTHECLNRAPDAGLASNADFKRLSAELGSQVNDISYVSPRLFQQLKRLPEMNPQMDAPAKAVMTASMGSFAVPERPIMSVLQNVPDGVLSNSRINKSFKQPLLAAVVYNPLTLTLLVLQQQQQAKAALASSARVAPALPPRPPVPQMPKLSPDEKVRRNLGLLRALAEAHYRRTKTDTATFSDLVGPGKLIPQLTPAEGEDYSTIHFQKGQPIEVTLPDGRVLTYKPVGARPGP